MEDSNTNTTPVTSPEGGHNNGTMIGSIIVVIILILGAIYLFYNKAEAPTGTDTGENTETTMPSDSAMDNGTAAPGNSDDIAAIESDLNVVSQDAEPELNAIEAELGN